MKLELPDELSSRQDLRALILEIKAYARWFSQAMVKSRSSSGQNQNPPAISSPAVEIVKKWHGQEAIGPKTLDKLIAGLEEYAVSAPTIKITLAAAASRELKNALITWCRKNIKPNILVDFKFNSTMLGGMVVSYDSHVYDWSFKRQILTSSDKFPEILRNV